MPMSPALGQPAPSCFYFLEGSYLYYHALSLHGELRFLMHQWKETFAFFGGFY